MSSSSKTLTLEIADYIVNEGFDRLPGEVIRLARRCFVDGIAVTLAGSTATCARILHDYLKEMGASGPSTVLGTDLRVPASQAALANGASAHALDYDDTQLSTTPDRVYGLLTHPTTPVLAAALAVGEEQRASGRAVLEAFCTGFEVECKIAEAIDPRHYLGGFHSTGTIGIFGATAATAKLLGLGLPQVKHALGIAASKSAGIRVNFGTMTKPYHAGAAAENGVVAAKLARLGYQASPDALGGPWGFFQVAGGGCDPQRIVGKLGNPYTMLDPGFSIKPYPCGSLAHPSMDTLLDLLVENDVKPQQIREIRLGTSSSVLNALRYSEPQDELEAKFSIQFCLGILALERQAGIAQFTDETVRRADVRQMMGRVKPYLHDDIEARGFDRIRSLVGLHLTDGRVLSREADTSRGTPQRPMSSQELAEKFGDCAEGVLPPGQVPQVLEAIYALDEMADIGELVRMLG